MRRIAILFMAVMLSACGDSTAPEPSDLRWMTVASPTLYTLVSIWGSKPSSIWTVGQYGQTSEVYHYDGKAWSTVLQGSFYESVWGTSGSDVWAVGCCTTFISHFDGTAWSDVGFNANKLLRAVWGTSPSNVWSVGNGGTIVHYDGQQWSTVASGTTEDLTSVWGTSSSDVWAAGYSTILHYDGSSWSVSYTPTPVDNALILAGWSSSPTDAWAMGSAGIPGKAFHYNGSAWAPAATPTVGTSAVWGTGPTNVWAVGVPACCVNCVVVTPCSANGTVQDLDSGVRHWDGSAWTSVDVGSSKYRYGIWASSASDIWIVGEAGSIVRGLRF